MKKYTIPALIGAFLLLIFSGVYAMKPSTIETQKEQLNLNRDFRTEIREDNKTLQAEIDFNTTKIDMNNSTLKRAEKQADCLKESINWEYKDCPMDWPIEELVENMGL